MWHTETLEPACEPILHGGIIRRGTFLADGTALLLASSDKKAIIWDIATGRQVGPARRHPGPVKAVALSSDGEKFITGDAAGSARIFTVPPPPLPDDPDRIELRMQHLTGMELDARYRMVPLDSSRWWEIRRQLDELGGSAESKPESPEE